MRGLVTLDSIDLLQPDVTIRPMEERDQGAFHALRNEQLVALNQQYPNAFWDQMEWWMRIGRALPFWTAQVNGSRAFFGLTPLGSRNWKIKYLETPGSPPELVFVCMEKLIQKAEEYDATRLSAITHLVPESSHFRTALLQMGFQREGCVREGYHEQRTDYMYDEIYYGFLMWKDKWLSGMEELFEPVEAGDLPF